MSHPKDLGYAIVRCHADCCNVGEDWIADRLKRLRNES